MTDETQTPQGEAAPVEAAPAPTESTAAPEVAPASGEATSAIPAVNESGAAPQSSAANVSQDAGASPSGASSAEPQTFEQIVEARFLALEGYLVKLPHSIAHAISQGSAEPEELAKRALAHLFAKDQ